MIISASRRTDIPAFYATWFMNRIRAGYCTVPNPFNRKQVAYVPLTPERVEVIVFWTRNPRPLFPHLAELDARGYRYYFQYTLLNNPRPIDPKAPPAAAALKTFHDLAAQIGPERVVWRYDPIVFSTLTGFEFHRETYQYLAEALRGDTHRSVISIVDDYRKTRKRMAELGQQGITVDYYDSLANDNLAKEGAVRQFDEFMLTLARIAAENDLEIVSCAETLDLQPYGIRPGKCIDDDYIKKIFGFAVGAKKDPAQRKACGCVVSKDIGMYNSCLFGCQYCYATQNFAKAKRNYEAHNLESPSLIGWYDAAPKNEP